VILEKHVLLQSWIKTIRGPFFSEMKLEAGPFQQIFQNTNGFRMSFIMYDVIICSN